MKVLGHLFDALTYPRRLLWRTLGLPEQGSEILAHLGLDPNETATRILGTGLEVASDPLAIFSGSALGSQLLAKLGAGAANPGMLSALDDLAIAVANTRGTQEGMEPDHPLANFLPPPTQPLPAPKTTAGAHHAHRGGSHAGLVSQ